MFRATALACSLLTTTATGVPAAALQGEGGSVTSSAAAARCPDRQVGKPATGQKLVADCVACITASTKAGCTTPKFCVRAAAPP
jgi:hypothetical protein